MVPPYGLGLAGLKPLTSGMLEVMVFELLGSLGSSGGCGLVIFPGVLGMVLVLLEGIVVLGGSVEVVDLRGFLCVSGVFLLSPGSSSSSLDDSVSSPATSIVLPSLGWGSVCLWV